MSKEIHDRLPSDEAAVIEAAAVAWLCERDEAFTPERAAAFAAWRAADPRHRTAVAKVERGLELLHELPAASFAVEARLTGRRERIAHTPGSARIPAWAWATGLAAGLLVGLLFWRFPLHPPAEAQMFAASAFGPTRAVLGDGSIVNVNTQGKLEVQLGARERRVTLAQGEAHFEVKADPARPFIVVAGGVTVRAVGTMFDIRINGDAVEVLVEEGKVTVAPVPSPAPRIEKMEPPKMAAALQWHRRVALFNDTPLREVVAQFNRRNEAQISLADDELGARRFGGALALDHVDALLRLLEREGGIAVERRAPNELVLRRVP